MILTRLSQEKNFKNLIVSIRDKFDKKDIYSSEHAEDGGYLLLKKPEQCRGDCAKCYVDHDVCEWIDYFPESFLWEYYRKIAIFRFFEIWGDIPRKKEKIINGMGIDKEKEASISGMMSNLSQLGIVKKDKDGNWVCMKLPEDYVSKNHFIILTPDAIRICREQARKFKELSNET